MAGDRVVGVTLQVAMKHGLFDQISENTEMSGQSVKQLPLGCICGEVAYQCAFCSVAAELLQLSLVVLHRTYFL